MNQTKFTNNEELWQAILARAQLEVSSPNFNTWFKNTSVVSQTKEEIIIGVPNLFTREWFEKKYNKLINAIILELFGEEKKIVYKIFSNSLRTVPIKPTATSLEEDRTQPLNLTASKDSGLSPRYSFENFIVGGFNELAHAASVAVIKSPGTSYNPLFIYGGVGLGKTHLLQAIGNEILKNSPDRNIKYLSTERFVTQIVNAIKNGDIDGLKTKYQTLDVFILDDVQFISKKEKCQEEFFHIFNSLYQKNKQIILSSDKPPRAIASLAERLRSRFDGGMVVDIGTPDFETRLAILKKKLEERKASLPEDVLNFVARNVEKNIREIEGALNILINWQTHQKKIIDVGLAQSLLKKSVTKPKIITPKKVLEEVAEFYNLTEKELLKKNREKEIVRPRQIVMYLLKNDLKSSYPEIGRFFGGKDHTTVMYGVEKISKEIEKNKNLEEEILLIRERIFER